jgi:hypothetical protein
MFVNMNINFVFCQMQVDYNHRCFILKEKIIDKKITGFIFFDYECMQEINGQHTPNLIITHTYNLNDEKCMDTIICLLKKD